MPDTDADRENGLQPGDRRPRRFEYEGATPGTTSASSVRLQTAADVLALLAEQIEAVRAEQEAGVMEKARAVGHLAAVGLKAIEAGNLEARLEALEAVLKQRGGGDRR